jgi:hypothetical protein
VITAAASSSRAAAMISLAYEWINFSSDGDMSAALLSPFWFLDLLFGFEPHGGPVGESVINGQIDIVLADERSRFGIKLVGGTTLRRLRRLATVVHLGSEGLPVSIEIQMPDAQYLIEFSLCGRAMTMRPDLAHLITEQT